MTAEPATPPMGWRSRIVGAGEEAPDQLVANPANWRVHPKAQQTALATVLDDVGWVGTVLVNRRTGHVVDGHLRVELAISRGEPKVPVTYVDLTEDEERKVLASLDPLSAMAGVDEDQLAALLDSVTLDNEELEAHLVSFLAQDRRTAGASDPDDVPEPVEEPYVKPGDLWRLGAHRLLCGDATRPEDVTRLMAGTTARMAFTDPPWNVAIGGDGNPRHRQRQGLVNDDLSAPAFASMLEALGRLLATEVAGDVYVVMGAAEWPTIDLALRGAGIHWSATIVWAKDLFVLGRSKYHRRYEPMWYGWPASVRSSFDGGRDQDDVWEIARPKRSEEHPTMKPVELVSRAVANSSKTGDVVLDPFVGSGTTIIAAEELGRRCYAIDVDPRFVQVAIERWQTFTGQQAERVQEDAG